MVVMHLQGRQDNSRVIRWICQKRHHPRSSIMIHLIIDGWIIEEVDAVQAALGLDHAAVLDRIEPTDKITRRSPFLAFKNVRIDALPKSLDETLKHRISRLLPK